MADSSIATSSASSASLVIAHVTIIERGLLGRQSSRAVTKPLNHHQLAQHA
jgi:hypothetical protein